MEVHTRNIEGDAMLLYDLAGVDVRQPPGSPALARTLLGPRSLRRIHRRNIRGDGALARVSDNWFIYVADDLAVEDLNFVVAHEIAEWFYRDLSDGDIERACDALAAALVAPKFVVRAEYRRPSDIRTIARVAVCSETCAALRVGEVLQEPVAVVAPTHTHTRPPGLPWRQLPRLTRVRLRDAPRRYALLP